jgi:thiamine-phosphate diphosphorylase
VRPLPRLHAITDNRILSRDDLGIRAAAIAAAGSGVALHVRDRAAGGQRLTGLTRRFLALAGPPEAAILVNGHPEIAQGTGAQGVQLGSPDLRPGDARRIFPRGWIGCSVHNEADAEAATSEGADFLLAGSVYETSSHPGTRPQGVDLVRRCARFGVPVIAIGGVRLERIAELRDAGAYGVASLSALWDEPDPAAAAVAMLEEWSDSGE